MKIAAPILSLLICFGASAVAVAEPPRNIGPEVVKLGGNLSHPFQHRKHQKDLGNECFQCHGSQTPGIISEWGEEKAHRICISCHDLEDKGPQQCNECHNQ